MSVPTPAYRFEFKAKKYVYEHPKSTRDPEQALNFANCVITGYARSNMHPISKSATETSEQEAFMTRNGTLLEVITDYHALQCSVRFTNMTVKDDSLVKKIKEVLRHSMY